MYLYSGTPKTFLQYLDGTTNTTLKVEPGNVYHVVPTDPTLPVLPYGYAASFTEVKSEDDEDRNPPPPSPTPEEATMTGESGVDHTESE